MKKKLLALALVLALILSVGGTPALAYAFPGSSAAPRDDVRYFDMTAAEYIDRFNAKFGGMGLTLLADPSHDNCWLAVNGGRTDIRIQFSDKINGPVTTGSGLDMQKWNWLYAYISTSDYSVDTQFFASLPMLCSQLASVLGCEFTQEEFIDHCTTYGSDYPRMQYNKGGLENEIRFRDSSIMDYHQTVYSVSILLVQDAPKMETTESEKEDAGDEKTLAAAAPVSTEMPDETVKNIAFAFSGYHTTALRSDGTVAVAGRGCRTNSPGGDFHVEDWRNVKEIAVSYVNVIGLKNDGTVVGTSIVDNGFVQALSDWRNVEHIFLRNGKSYYSCACAGLCSDGTILIADNARNTINDAHKWTDILKFEFANSNTLSGSNTLNLFGLRSDGTVVACGDYNTYGQLNVSGWNNIKDIKASTYHTVGLKTDGTVVATGWNQYGQCDVEGWEDICSIFVGDDCTLGLRRDGTVVAAGNNRDGQLDVDGWSKITKLAVCSYADSYMGTHVVGLCSDGTVVAAGDNTYGQCNVSGWTDIIDIAAARLNTAALAADGTIYVIGDNTFGQCDVDELNAPVLAAKENSHKDSTGSYTTQSPASNGPAAPSTGFNYTILQNEPGYIYDKFDEYWTWYAAYDEAYTDADLLIGIQLEGEVGGSDLAGVTLYTKIRDKSNKTIDGVQSMAFLVDGVKYSFPEMPGEDGAMAGSVVLYKNGYELIKAFANAKEVSVKLKLFSGGTVLLDLDSAQFDRTLGNMCRKIIQYKVWDSYIENPAVEMLEMMFPMEITKK